MATSDKSSGGSVTGEASDYRTGRDSASMSMVASRVSDVSTNIVYTPASSSEKSEYFDEWLQKCVAWVAYGRGINRMDLYSLEKVSNYIKNEIKAIGRRAAHLGRIRGSDICNFVDVSTALEQVNPVVHSNIFEKKQLPTVRQLPKQIAQVSHSNLIQPALLAQPSALYFGCMVSAGQQISQMHSEQQQNDNLPKPKINETIDLEYILTSSNRNTYSVKNDEQYQQIVANVPKFCHRHMPLLPPDFHSVEKKTSLNYQVNDSMAQEKLAKQNLLLQAELPSLHRVQERPF